MVHRRSAEWLELVGGGAAGTVASVLGGGGKTTLVELLGVELAKRHSRVLVSSLTHTLGRLAHGAVSAEEVQKAGLGRFAAASNPVRVLGPLDVEGKASGIAAQVLEELVAQAEVTVFECDGARNLPLKVHVDRDPQVPGFSTHALLLVGAEVVGSRIEEGLVHRPDLFAERWNVGREQLLDADLVATVVTSKAGYLSKVPAGIETIYFVNKADMAMEAARLLGEIIARRGEWPVYYGSLHENWFERIQ